MQVDYFKYDNCYPRLDGETNTGQGVNIDLAASTQHWPSLYQVMVMVVNDLSLMVQEPPERERYQAMAAELAAARPIRNITFELCAWGFGNVETFGREFGHLWRTRYRASAILFAAYLAVDSMDISDTWQQTLWNIDINDETRYRGPAVQGPTAGWNYPDGKNIALHFL